MFLIALEYAILASTFTIAKIALAFAKPFFLIGIRMIVAGALLLGYQLLFNRNKFVIHKSDFVTFIKVSFFHVYIAFLFEFWALQYMSSAKTSIIYSLTPFIAAFLSYLLLNQKLTLIQIGAMVMGFVGMLPLIMGGALEHTWNYNLLGITLPEVVLFIAVVSASYAWFIVKDLMGKGYSLPLINGVSFLVGGIASLLTSFIIEGTSTSPIYHMAPFLFWTMLLVLVANIISYNFYGWLLRRYSITFMTFAGFLCPLFGSLYGWLFLNEKITWHYFVALAFVTIGLYLFYRDDLRSERIKS